MPRYLVRCENNPVGEVTAPDTSAAVNEAYKLRDWSPRDAMSLLTLPEAVMHILIDTTNSRALARHESYRALAALHYIQFANVDACIIRCDGQNKHYSQFSHEALMSLLAYAGAKVKAKDYTELLKLCRETLETASYLDLPFATAELDRQAHAIAPGDDRPMAFKPGAVAPDLVPRWTTEPQINRKRADSSFWVNFAAGDVSGQSNASALPADAPSGRVRGRNTPPIPSNEDTMASTKAAKKAATKKVAKKTAAPAKKAAAKKAPAPATKKAAANGAQEERNGIKRPKPGGNTAQVWDACDALYAKGKVPSFKEVDEYIEKKNDQIPTATRRSNYAVWRKFNGITGRVG